MAPQTGAQLSEPLVTTGVFSREVLRTLRSLVPATRRATTLDTPQLRETLSLGCVTISMGVFCSQLLVALLTGYRKMALNVKIGGICKLPLRYKQLKPERL